MQISTIRAAGLGVAMAAAVGFAAPAAASYGVDNDPSFSFGSNFPGHDGGREDGGDRGKGRINDLILRHAQAHGVPVKLARAVVKVESNFNPKVRGRAGEIGLMQIKPATARGLGFSSSASALYNPDTNLKWGMSYLATAYKLAGGDVCGTILRYNAGHGARRMNPVSRRYCGKVQALMRSGDSAA